MKNLKIFCEKILFFVKLNKKSLKKLGIFVASILFLWFVLAGIFAESIIAVILLIVFAIRAEIFFEKFNKKYKY